MNFKLNLVLFWNLNLYWTFMENNMILFFSFPVAFGASQYEIFQRSRRQETC
jgi:hypothetical protein